MSILKEKMYSALFFKVPKRHSNARGLNALCDHRTYCEKLKGVNVLRVCVLSMESILCNA